MLSPCVTRLFGRKVIEKQVNLCKRNSSSLNEGVPKTRKVRVRFAPSPTGKKGESLTFSLLSPIIVYWFVCVLIDF